MVSFCLLPKCFRRCGFVGHLHPSASSPLEEDNIYESQSGNLSPRAVCVCVFRSVCLCDLAHLKGSAQIHHVFARSGVDVRRTPVSSRAVGVLEGASETITEGGKLERPQVSPECGGAFKSCRKGRVGAKPCSHCCVIKD